MAVNPGDLYANALEGGSTLQARDSDGTLRVLPLDMWIQDASGADARLVARAVGPVLDVGCGPGRHVHALAARGVIAVGVDVNPAALQFARARGATVLEVSIFDRIPGAGEWRTALLLDGNIGIGGAPAALLARIASLLSADGQIIVEVDPPGVGLEVIRMRLEDEQHESHWFDWARVGADALKAPAREAGLRVAHSWEDDGRWFAVLEARA
ncbi:MAG: methyltransferase protein [Solirubrobacterales bacterium]|jgi:SAM-dependent methyltransferase|nr:methyltransferase protein [Solirubrobacterales bacterium]